MQNLTEKRFEDDIEASLLSQGYFKGNPKNFDRKLALDIDTFIDFIKESQARTWEKYTKTHGDNARNFLIKRFCDAVSEVGMLKVLREGFVDRGIKFKVVAFKPETALNQTTQHEYNSNIFHCTRQVKYSQANENSVDIVLFINGIPLVSMELKNQFTGQNTDNAIKQYKFSRSADETIFQFNKRVLVHFAVDLKNVYMTTKLQGTSTYFLPFNQGSNGAGNVGGSGNPANPNGYETEYLWEKVLQKDKLLEVIQKYLHLEEKDKKGKKISKMDDKTLIFPRYHQLDVVSKLLDDVKTCGSGKSYLIQHSAGSGKSNSISWLAHRLSSLHDENNNQIFNSVIVVTDRIVLDEQLQENIYQFDHVEGVVKKVKKSSELKDAINDGVRIIVSTLFKFPVVFKEVESKNKRFAIIIDEAHSSQTGNASKKLKYALADIEKTLKDYAEFENEEEKNIKDNDDLLLEELATHGTHENLSFFAFTATPKDKTLQVFGTLQPTGEYAPFHVYSMKQAIEEGFILDVLKNYMTYNMYFKIAKNIPDDPELDSSAGLRAIRNYESLHPHNISQKTKVMLEHFQNITRHKINGRAKAMLVTPSRLHAVRYVEEFRKQINEQDLDFNVLVAFSGEINDNGEIYTEEGLNKTTTGETIKEKQLPKVFASEEYGMLIVAEKYQTGFDQPLLHTMFVDKALSGVKAVQTLSRLNRTTKGKNDTFILDFVNNADDIENSFNPYYEQTILTEETDPNTLYKMKSTLEEYRVFNKSDIENCVNLFYSTFQPSKILGKLQATIQPSLENYSELSVEDKDVFKTGLARFCRIYAFITHVCRMFDKELHKFSIYAKFLLKFLPKDVNEKIDLDGKILLEYYKLEKDFEGSIALTPSVDGVSPIKGETGKKEKKKDPLTTLIDKINEKYHTNFTDQDKLMMQYHDRYVKDKFWQNMAKGSDEKTFIQRFEKDFINKTAISLYEENIQMYNTMFENKEMLNFIADYLGKLVYSNLKKK